MKSNKKLFGRVLAMALAIVMTLSMPGVGQVFASADGDSGDDANPVVITQEFEPESDDSVLDDVLDVDDAGPQEGTSEGPGSVSDGVDVIPGDNTQDEIKSDSEASDGGFDDVLDPGQDDAADVIPGGQEPGVNPDDIQNPGGTDVVPGDDDGDPDLDPGIDPDRAVIEAALESFQSAYQAFVSEFAHEKAMHLDGLEHICAYRDFDAFLDRLDLVFASASGVDLSGEAGYIAMIDDLDEKLSEAAVGAYLARGEAILSGEYAGLARFDADVSHMNELRQYMTHDALRSTAVVSMAEQVGFARAELADGLDNSNASETPEILGVPAPVQAVRDAYAALCDGIDSLSFGQILVRLDRIADLIDQVDPEDMTDDVLIISGYLLEIKSQRALAEFCTQVLIIREKAAAGRYDNTAEGFDRAAAQAEFDAIRSLSRYMLQAELNSENYTNGLKALVNLEILMDTPVDWGLSERAEAFLVHVEQIQEAAGTEYANRPYALDKALEALLTECNSLDPSDLLDENVQTAKTILENMRRRIVIKPEIYAFLDAAYALLDALNAGESLESDHVVNLAMAVADAMDLLTESDLENLEVLAVYRQLSEAGLVPDGEVIQDRFQMLVYPWYLSPVVVDNGDLNPGDPFFGYGFASCETQGFTGFRFENFLFQFFDYAADNSLQPDVLNVECDDLSAVRVFASTVSTDTLIQEFDRIAPYNNCDLSQTIMMAFVNGNYTELPVTNGKVALPDGVTSCIVWLSGDLKSMTSAPSSVDIAATVSSDTPAGGFVAGDCVHTRVRIVGFPVYPGTDEWFNMPVVGTPNSMSASYFDFRATVIGRQVSGVLANGGKPVENAELALFSYDSGAYVRLERDIHGNRIEAIRTDSNGAYLIPELPEGDYYLAVRNVDKLTPVENSGLMAVMDDMHGLSGWQFVTETPAHLYSCSEFIPIVAADPSNYLQNVVLDFEFETSTYTGAWMLNVNVSGWTYFAVDEAEVEPDGDVLIYGSSVWQNTDVSIDAQFESFSFLFFDYDRESTIYPETIAIEDRDGNAVGRYGTASAFVSTVPMDMLLQACDEMLLNLDRDATTDDVLAFINSYYDMVTISDGYAALPNGVTSCIVVYQDDLMFSPSTSEETPEDYDMYIFVQAHKPDDSFVAGDLLRTRYRYVAFGWIDRLSNRIVFSPDSGVNASRGLFDTVLVAVGRELSGRLTCYNMPVENAEFALFSYDVNTNAYARLERDVTGNRIETIRTDENGNYLIPKLPAGDYYLAVRNLGSLAPFGDSSLTAVSDDMHGLSSWQFVSNAPVHVSSCDEFSAIIKPDRWAYLEAMKTDPSKYLQSIVQDFDFQDDPDAVSPVELSYHIWEKANHSGFAVGKSGLLPFDEKEVAWGVEYEHMQREFLLKGAPVASLAPGDIGYATADIRVTAESGARDIDLILRPWNDMGATCVDSVVDDIIGIYELDTSGRPVRMLQASEYTIGTMHNGDTYITFSDELMFYGAAYRVLYRFRVLDQFGFGSSCVYCDYGAGVNYLTSELYIDDTAWWWNGAVEVHKTDMSGADLPGAEFQLFWDEDCTEPISFVMFKDSVYPDYAYVSDLSDDVKNVLAAGDSRLLLLDQTYTTLTLDVDTASFCLWGLRSGAYYLKEVTYPNGYESADGGPGVTKIYINNHDGQVVEGTDEEYVTIQNREIDPTWIEYSMSKTVSVDSDFDFDSNAADAWLLSQNDDLTKLTIDKIGKPVDEFNYTYTLRFDMADPGVGQYKAVDDLVLYDDLESGTDSRYAGRLDHISISGLDYGWLALLQSLIPDSIGDNETLVYSLGLDSTHCSIYVSAAGVAPDADLPDVLVSITGRSDWVETDEALSNVDKDKITAVAVYLPGLMVAHDVTTINLDSPAYLQVDLHMVHAGHADYTGADKILTNGFTAGYIADGADEFTIDTRLDLTEVEIVYKNTGVALPVTGGPGVTGVLVTGLVFLVPAAFVLAVKKRED